MKLKHLTYPDHLNSDVNKKGIMKSSVLSEDNNDIFDATEKKNISIMKEMEKTNAILEDLLEESTKKLNEVIATNTKFMTIIAHDLRSPFCSILGALDLLKEKLEESNIKDVDGYINIASDSANKTLGLLEGLLEWSFSQNEEKSFTPIKINLHELITGEIESIILSSIQKNIKLHHTIVPNLYVTADLQMVKTIFRNLISNAIKYTNNGGEITISAIEIKPYVEISVKDNGIGISKEDQAELFKIDKFHSIAGTNNEKGAGLGLLICKEFVEMHGEKIWINSELGMGSEFKFTLPHYI